MTPHRAPGRPRAATLLALLGLLGAAQPALARLPLELIEGLVPDSAGTVNPRGRSAPEALPDIFGPGAVLSVGSIQMKVTNNGWIGDGPFAATSSDPSAQWPGASGIEYLYGFGLAVGAVNPTATSPDQMRRVSYGTEWRPATLDPEDRIYRSYDGIINGSRFVDDDGDRQTDEDFLDGRDNDGDGRIDEDFGAVGQQMYSCTMWDNTIQAINTTRNEKHVPLGLECRQKAWAYSVEGFQDFNVIEYEIFNRSGHVLDSLVVGWVVDMDCGPTVISNYYQDDLPLQRYPNGQFSIRIGGLAGDLADCARLQCPRGADPTDKCSCGGDSALCPRLRIRVNGFSLVDDEGDLGKTAGVPSFLLFTHTLDPTGNAGPARVGFHAFRQFSGSTPYIQGGFPAIDQQKFESMTISENIDTTGFIFTDPNADVSKGDWAAWCSVGPWLNVPDGGSVTATIGFAVRPGSFVLCGRYGADYDAFRAAPESEQGRIGAELLARYPGLNNAFSAQVAYEGIHEVRDNFTKTDYFGRETAVKLKRGEQPTQLSDCHDEDQGNPRSVTDQDYTWFDFDCDYCTGVWDYATGQGIDPTAGGLFHKVWNAEAPPPSPSTNVSAGYNFTDNPSRTVVPSSDKAIVLAWDNLSEITADPKAECFDFRGYRLWKVSDWKRPVGSAGPSESDWRLLGEFRMFDYYTKNDATGVPIERNYAVDTTTGQKVCPEVFIPNYVYYDSTARVYRQGKKVPICLDRGDLWNRQTGEILEPDTSLRCITVPGDSDSCVVFTGGIVQRQNMNNGQGCLLASNKIVKNRYPVGRYRYVDREVKNGFLYFYSVTAFDSTYNGVASSELGGRRAAVEAEGVTPQARTGTGRQVWVVPNPYRGYGRLTDRPSAWDMTPNASDPTGTHIDFLGLPAGGWTIRIYTISGDLVAILRSTDPINESIRTEVKIGDDPITRQAINVPGYNRQQDNPNDGQASWNLISRNGQDIVSGIYIFTVDSKQGTQRGKFVVIR